MKTIDCYKQREICTKPNKKSVATYAYGTPHFVAVYVLCKQTGKEMEPSRREAKKTP